MIAMKMNIDIIREAIEIPYISESHAAFANHILGRLQQQIKETIASGDNDISIVRISKIINASKEYAENLFGGIEEKYYNNQ